MLSYKIDILPALKAKGYTTTKIRREHIISEASLQSIRQCKPISWVNIDKLCELLECQPGDILEYIPNGPNGTTQELANDGSDSN